MLGIVCSEGSERLEGTKPAANNPSEAELCGANAHTAVHSDTTSSRIRLRRKLSPWFAFIPRFSARSRRNFIPFSPLSSRERLYSICSGAGLCLGCERDCGGGRARIRWAYTLSSTDYTQNTHNISLVLSRRSKNRPCAFRIAHLLSLKPKQKQRHTRATQTTTLYTAAVQWKRFCMLRWYFLPLFHFSRYLLFAFGPYNYIFSISGVNVGIMSDSPPHSAMKTLAARLCAHERNETRWKYRALGTESYANSSKYMDTNFLLFLFVCIFGEIFRRERRAKRRRINVRIIFCPILQSN